MVLGILGMEFTVFLAMSMFAVFMVLILTGYNVAFSFASTALAFAFLGDLLGEFDPLTMNVLPGRWYGALSDQTLLAVPLFVLMGAILERSGLAERLLTAIGMLMGSLRGGVAAAVVLVGTLMAAATGVVAATVIVMGILSLPAMIKLGYDHKLATGVIIASGTLAQLVPPSLVLILLAQQLGVGILGLFAGALIPGLILAAMYAAYALGISYLKPHMGPAMPREQRTLEGKLSRKSAVIIAGLLALLLGMVSLLLSPGSALIALVGTFVVLLAILLTGGMLTTEIVVSVVPILVLIVGVLVSIFQGVATPSESGSVGGFGALLLTVLNWYFDRLLHRDGAEHITPRFGALLLTVLNWYFDRLLHRDGAEHITPRWRLTPTAIYAAGTSTANIVVLVMTLLFSSTFFSLMFFQLGGSDQTSDWLTAVGGGKLGFVAVAMVAVFLLGINLEFIEITFIVVPIFVPAMQELGFTAVEKIWFAVLMAVNLNMAFISPPVGFSLFYLQSVAPPEVKTADIHKGAFPFMGIQIIFLVILGVFPGITEFSFRFFSGA